MLSNTGSPALHSVMAYWVGWSEGREAYRRGNLHIIWLIPHSNTLAWKMPWMEEPGGL